MGYMARRFVSVCVAAVVVAGCSSSSTHAKSSVVTGFIEPCIGSARYRPPYAAGTVTALRGVERLRSIRKGEQQVVLPSDVIARQHVAENQRYRFVLPPGRYVLAATYDVSGDGRTFVDLNVPTGARMQTNLPNHCK
jgi:hypothetical protein